jgi:hypothetical protein
MKTSICNLVQQNSKRRKGFIHHSVNNSDGVQSKLPVAKRRSVAIDQTVWDGINDLRASALKSNFEIDFTTALNLLAECGMLKIQENDNSGGTDSKVMEIMNKYLDYEELQESGILDDWQNFQEFREWKQNKEKTKLEIKNKEETVPR